MFNWTTTTIINSLKDYTNPDLDLMIWDNAKEILRIKRHFTLEKRYVTNINKAVAADPTLFEMTIDLNTLVSALTKDTYGTLAFYIGLEGSEESIYANDWYQKGRPFSIGFEYIHGTTTADAMATTIANNAKKFGVMTFGKRIFSLEAGTGANSGKLLLKGAHEYQRIMKAAIITDDGIYDKFLYTYEDNGIATQNIFTLTNRGTNGFGTYNQLVKDLRLPTPEHTKFYQIMADETPIPGAKYNQYILTYNAPSLANPGFGVIGEKHTATETTHIFWVKQDIDAVFDNYMQNLSTINTYSASNTAGSTVADTYTLTLTNNTLSLDSSTTTGSVAGTASPATGATLTYTSSKPTVATVAANGTVTRVAAGTAKITVKATWTNGATETKVATVTCA